MARDLDKARILVQSINFYRPKVVKYAWFNINFVGFSVLGLCLSLFFYQTLQSLNLNQLKADNQIKQSRLNVYQAKVLQLKNKNLTAKLSEIEPTLKLIELNKSKYLDVLMQMKKIEQKQALISPVLKALITAVMPELWLTNFSVGEGGKTYDFEGQTLKPELLPELIHRFSQISIFNDAHFDVIKLQQYESNLPYHFQLKTKL